MEIKSLRGKIGYVGQEPILFNQTIRENILSGVSHEVENDELRRVINIANAEFIYHM